MVEGVAQSLRGGYSDHKARNSSARQQNRQEIIRWEGASLVEGVYEKTQRNRSLWSRLSPGIPCFTVLTER